MKLNILYYVKLNFVVNYLFIFTWFFGLYEEISTPYQEEVYFFGGGILIGLIIMHFLNKKASFLEKYFNISVWMCFSACFMITYILIFNIPVLSLILSTIIGCTTIIILFLFQKVEKNKSDDNNFLTFFLLGGFIIFLGWLASLFWSFRYVGLFLSSVITLMGTQKKENLFPIQTENQEIKTPKKQAKQKRGYFSLLNCFILFYFICIASVSLLLEKSIKEYRIELSSDQFLSQLFYYAGFSTAAISFLFLLERKKIIQTILICMGIILLVFSLVMFFEPIPAFFVSSSNKIVLFGIMYAVLFPFISNMILSTEKFARFIVFLMILQLMGILLLSDLDYPIEWFNYVRIPYFICTGCCIICGIVLVNQNIRKKKENN